MSTVLDSLPSGDRNNLFRISVDFYHELGRLGLLGEKDVELLDGFIFERIPKSPLHEHLVDEIFNRLLQATPPGSFATEERSLGFVASEPIPDVMVLPGSRSDYVNVHPSTALLVIEVSISTEATDRAKAPIYAAAKINEYWMVQPDARRVTVFSRPVEDGYAKQEDFSAAEVVTSSIVPGFSISLAELLPAA